jgi:tRNA (guanine-N7-)-methyltransferase
MGAKQSEILFLHENHLPLAKNKLAHFQELKTFPHVMEPTIEVAMSGESELQGSWHPFFGNNNPITLELGCGKGEYTVGMARMYPERNFIGVDIKGARIWRGAKTVDEEGIPNAAFLRQRIEFIASFFGKDEVEEIWLTFSDPQLKDGREKHRLTHPRFLDRYRKMVVPGAWIHVKTDSRFLADYTLEVLKEEGLKADFVAFDLYGADWDRLSESDKKHMELKTFYENKFLEKGIPINYIRFQLDGPQQ